MTATRKRIEDAIEGLIEALDEIDCDPDVEDDPLEEQHDAEADLTWTTAPIPTFYVIAETARRRANQRR